MRIGLVPISAKPYHAGHHALVTSAARDNDLVLLFVSTSDRKRKGEFPILGSSMIQVWNRYLEPIMPGNVEIRYGGSPVQKVYQALQDACGSASVDTFVVYSDPEDTAANYPSARREKYFDELCRVGQVVFAAEENPEMFTRGVGTPDISGTKMRAALQQGDVTTFAANMPTGVDAQGIFTTLGGVPIQGEALLRTYVGACLRG